MSKLDDILDQFTEPTGKEVYLKDLKEQIKDVFVEILDNTDVLGPQHPQTNIWYRDLKKKVEKL